MTRQTNHQFEFEKLENRCLLAVTAELVNGELRVFGDSSNGSNIVIVADDQGVFRVTNTPTLVELPVDLGTFSGVQSINVRVNAQSELTTTDRVIISLNNQQIDSVMGSLGSGHNEFTVIGNQQVDSVVFAGGEGRDIVNVRVNTTETRAMLRGGPDILNLDGDTDWLWFRGGKDQDVLNIGRSSTVKAGQARMGNGDFTVDVSGKITERIEFFEGNTAGRYLYGYGVDEVDSLRPAEWDIHVRRGERSSMDYWKKSEFDVPLQFIRDKVIGNSEQHAIEFAASIRSVYRIPVRDGVGGVGTADINPYRLNLIVVDSIVTNVGLG